MCRWGFHLDAGTVMVYKGWGLELGLIVGRGFLRVV